MPAFLMYINSILSFPEVFRKVVTSVHLDTFYEKEKPNFLKRISHDPVSFIHQWPSDEDREIAGFLAAQFAYGTIGAFMDFLRKLFTAMPEGPARFIQRGSWEPINGLYYRFQKDTDIQELLGILKKMLDDHKTLGKLFRSFYKGDTRAAIWNIRKVYVADTARLLFFFPREGSEGALKRWNMYLRWMVRKDEIDIGIWDFIDPADLVIPLDTHLHKIGTCRGWTSRKAPSYKAAQEITNALKFYSPSDPLKYDFFLCHVIGIASRCSGKKKPQCNEVCLIHEI